jgi:hypothetical protein
MVMCGDLDLFVFFIYIRFCKNIFLVSGLLKTGRSPEVTAKGVHNVFNTGHCRYLKVNWQGNNFRFTYWEMVFINGKLINSLRLLMEVTTAMVCFINPSHY